MFKLLEPVAYGITGAKVLGNNTIWTDTGDSALTYLAKKA